jgi:ATP-dependent Clp protease ATP-binding subunit ClpA
MFERFTKRARTVVERGQRVARDAGASEVRSDHLLLGVLEDEESLAVRVLGDLGVGSEQVREAVVRLQAHGRGGGVDEGDAEALQAIGIDLDEVRKSVEDNLGAECADPSQSGKSRHLRFAKDAKKVLELALREAIALKHNYIGTEHILLGLLRIDQGVVGAVFAELGLSHRAVKTAVLEALRRAG